MCVHVCMCMCTCVCVLRDASSCARVRRKGWRAFPPWREMAAGVGGGWGQRRRDRGAILSLGCEERLQCCDVHFGFGFGTWRRRPQAPPEFFGDFFFASRNAQHTAVLYCSIVCVRVFSVFSHSALSSSKLE